MKVDKHCVHSKQETLHLLKDDHEILQAIYLELFVIVVFTTNFSSFRKVTSCNITIIRYFA